MALPTYQRANVQVASPGGQAGTAGLMAKAQGDMSLAQKLSNFSGQLTGIAGSMAKDQAAKDAVVDIQKRKQQVLDIQKKGLDAETEQAEIDKIVEGTERKLFGVYSQAYNNAALSAYSNQVQVDAKGAADIAEAQAGGDPDAFINAYKGFGAETVKGAPSEHTKVVAQQAITKYGAERYKKLMTAKYKQDLERRESTFKDTLDLRKEDYLQHMREGNFAEARLTLGGLQYVMQGGIEDGFYNPSKAQTEMKVLSQAGVVEYEKSYFSNEQVNGYGVKAYQDFKNKVAAKHFTDIAPDKLKELDKYMRDSITSQNNYKQNLRTEQTNAQDFEQEQTYNELLKKAALNELQPDEVVDALGSGSLSKGQAGDLDEVISAGGSRQYSDQNQLALYSVPDSLVLSSEEDIYNDPLLSFKDKGALIRERDGLLEGKYNWMKSNDGRTATTEIKRLFGIEGDTLQGQIDFTGRTMTAMSDMMKRLYDEVSKIEDPTVRSGESLNIARRLISEYKGDKIQREVAKKQAIQEKVNQKADEDAATYNSSAMGQFMQMMGSEPRTRLYYPKTTPEEE